MAAKGIYRTKSSNSHADIAFVDYGSASSIGQIPRWRYEEANYEPPFGSLPIKEDYEGSTAASS